MNHCFLLVGPVEGKDSITRELLDCSVAAVGEVQDVSPYYSLMDILLLPTHREGMPNAVLAAGASGIPTITTNATGAIDSVDDGVTGVIVPVGDKEAFLSAVLGLMKENKRCSQLGSNARERTISYFDQRHVTNLHVNYYSRLVERVGMRRK